MILLANKNTLYFPFKNTVKIYRHKLINHSLKIIFQIEQGKENGLKISAMLISMQSPMGTTVGNALEIKESIKCLYGKANKDLTETVCKLGKYFFSAYFLPYRTKVSMREIYEYTIVTCKNKL